MTKLTSTEGRRWAFMQRYDICDLADPTDLYLRRWRLVQTPWFGVYLHRMQRPDGDRYLHDHPWPFTSVILRGGYIESFVDWETHDPARARARIFCKVGRPHRMAMGDFHAIRRLLRVPTWTLVLVGRRVRDWGYLTDHGRWVSHDAQHDAWGIS